MLGHRVAPAGLGPQAWAGRTSFLLTLFDLCCPLLLAAYYEGQEEPLPIPLLCRRFCSVVDGVSKTATHLFPVLLQAALAVAARADGKAAVAVASAAAG